MMTGIRTLTAVKKNNFVFNENLPPWLAHMLSGYRAVIQNHTLSLPKDAPTLASPTRKWFQAQLRSIKQCFIEMCSPRLRSPFHVLRLRHSFSCWLVFTWPDDVLLLPLVSLSIRISCYSHTVAPLLAWFFPYFYILSCCQLDFDALISKDSPSNAANVNIFCRQCWCLWSILWITRLW